MGAASGLHEDDYSVFKLELAHGKRAWRKSRRKMRKAKIERAESDRSKPRRTDSKQ